METKFISKVWDIPKLIGNAIPGILVWDNGKILFITEEGIQFNVRREDLLAVKWPFLRMGFGFDTIVNGKKYRFSFSKPNHSSPDIDYTQGSPYPKVFWAGQGFRDLSSLGTIKTDRATTRKWKEILQR